MKSIGLTNNQLKIIALITMTVDHIGWILMPHNILLRIIGRLAYPIFAYMIAEGCCYTHNIRKYLGTMVAMAAVSQVVSFVCAGSLYQGIMTTFSLSICLVILLKNARKKNTVLAWCAVVAGVLAVFFLTEILPLLLPGTDYAVDYGFWGVLLPVFVYLGKDKWQKLLITGVLLVILWLEYRYIQGWSLLALPVLALYNGQRGRWRMKWLFYLYYPGHLAVIYIIAWLF